MDIDLAALRALERERGIALDVLIPAIEQALLVAYQRTDGRHRARPRRARPQERARRHLGARGDDPPRGGRGPARGESARVRRHPGRLRPDRGRPPPARSSCSGCATSRTS